LEACRRVQVAPFMPGESPLVVGYFGTAEPAG
jgi:hypothetical protein